MVRAHGEPASSSSTGKTLRPLSDAELTDEIIWALVDAAPDGLIMVDEAGRILLVNRQVEDIFGYERGELLGLPVETLIPPALRDVHTAHRTHYGAQPKVRAMGTGLDLRGYRKDGTAFPVEISLSPLGVGQELRVIAALRDVTERKVEEARLRRAQTELETLEDRERIARDLHDTVIQRLFAAGLSLQATASRVEEPAVASRIEQVIEQLDETIRELRHAIFGLEARGAGAGLDHEILRVIAEEQKGLGFEPKLAVNGSLESVDDDAAAQLLPTLREALSNVARHAGATAADVRIDVGQDLTLTISDDGRGFPDNPHPGNGLRNMESRAARLGGSLRLEKRPPSGTVVEWVVPLER